MKSRMGVQAAGVQGHADVMPVGVGDAQGGDERRAANHEGELVEIRRPAIDARRGEEHVVQG